MQTDFAAGVKAARPGARPSARDRRELTRTNHGPGQQLQGAADLGVGEIAEAADQQQRVDPDRFQAAA